MQKFEVDQALGVTFFGLNADSSRSTNSLHCSMGNSGAFFQS
jgi:hypothetical protein